MPKKSFLKTNRNFNDSNPCPMPCSFDPNLCDQITTYLTQCEIFSCFDPSSSTTIKPDVPKSNLNWLYGVLCFLAVVGICLVGIYVKRRSKYFEK